MIKKIIHLIMCRDKFFELKTDRGRAFLECTHCGLQTIGWQIYDHTKVSGSSIHLSSVSRVDNHAL